MVNEIQPTSKSGKDLAKKNNIMHAKSRKFWIRFGLLTSIPIILGLLSAIIFANLFKASYRQPFIKTVTESESVISQQDSIIGELWPTVVLLDSLNQLPQQAELELRQLKEDLSTLHSNNQSFEIDSLIQVYQNKIVRLRPAVYSNKQAEEIVKVIVNVYTDKALQMGLKVKNALKKGEMEKSENILISVLELHLERLKIDNEQLETKVKELSANISSLENQLEGCSKELETERRTRPSDGIACNHRICKINQDLAALKTSQLQIETFLKELKSLSSLTDWIFDKKVRDRIKELQMKFQESLDETNLRLDDVDRS